MQRTFGLICLVASCFVAPSSRALAEDTQPAVTFSGVVNQQIRVGAAFAKDRLALFFCGDASTVATHTRWITGEAQLDGKWRLFERDDWKVYVRFNAAQDRLEGWLAGPVASWWIPWVAPLAVDGRGLYRAVNEHGVLGAIVTDLNRDGVLELQGAIKSGSRFRQIVPLASVEPKSGDLEVSAPTDEGAFTPATVHEVTTVDF